MIMSQHLRQQPHPDFFPSHHNSSFHHGLPLRTAQLNSQRLNSSGSATSSDFDPSLYSSSPASTLASSPATVNQEYSDQYPDYYMPQNQLHHRAHFASPRSASAQNPSAVSADSASGFPASAWAAPHDGQSHLAPQQPQQRSRFPAGTFHRRNNSDSSVVTPAPSPYGAAAAYPHIVDAELSQYPSEHGLDLDQYPQPTYAKSLPPSATGTGFTETYYDFSPTSNNASDFLLFQQAMTNAAMAQQSGGDGRQPTSLLRQQSTAGGEFDDEPRTQIERGRLPKLDRTISDVYQDELFNPSLAASAAASAAPVSQAAVQSSPRRDLFAERLQAAKSDHLSAARSPVAAENPARNRSPFQPGSAAYAESATTAFASPAGMEQPGGAKTVSPKDVQNMEYEGPDDDAPAAFFPNAGFGESGVRPERRETESPERVRAQVLQQYPFSRRRPAPAVDAPPEFHASLTSMESTKSEPGEQAPAAAAPPASPLRGSAARTPPRSTTVGAARPGAPGSSRSPSSAASSRTSTPETPVRRPASTASDAGTYTCTYHGCPHRFETPALLQRHKREGHRQPTPGSAAHTAAAAAAAAAGGGGGSPLAAEGGAMSSQAGPHRCDRVNPATGRPCRSVFSRPYDLTRHEDTIHNARRAKARCPLCAEDKTFSRGDALTRHMRVVHPDVDFPGKHRRKGLS